MAKNSRNNSQRGRNDNTSFENFSKLLDEHTKALLKASEDFKKSAEAFNKNFDNLTGQDQKHRVEISKDARKLFDREAQSRNDNVVKGRKAGDAFVSSLKVVGKAFINQLDKSIEKVADKYVSQFSTITSRMQMSYREYATMFNEAATYFRNNGLAKQFTSAEFADSLTAALDTGLRGEEAKRQAYQNLITNKLVPAISTNTVAYRRMSKQFGDSFNEGITAIAKYTEKVYGAEGIEEGRINSIIDSLGLSARYAAAQQGLTGSQASDIVSRTTGVLTALGSTVGENFQAQIVDMLRAASSGETMTSGQSALAGIAGIYTAEQANAALMDPEKLTEVIGKILNQYADRSSNVLGVLSQSGLGYDLQAGQEAYIAMTEKSSGEIVSELSAFTKNFDASQVYQEERDKLEEGYYTDSSTALSNILSNMSTWFATWKSNIPMFDTIVDILGQIASIVVSQKIIGGISGGDAAGGIFSGLLKGGGKHAATSSVGTKLAAAGKLLAPVAGVALTGYDIVTGYKEGGLGQAAIKGLTGASDHESYKTGGLDAFKDAAKDTIKNATKGALIGSVVPGVGTAVGAGIGMVAGIAGSLGKYFSEENQLSRATKEYAESLDNLKEVQTQYEDVVKKTDNSLENLSKVSQINGKATDEQTEAFKQLKSAYPDLLANVSDVSEMDSAYVELLKMKIKIEKKEITDKLIDQTRDASKSAAKAAKKAAKQSGSQDMAGQDFLYQVNEGTSVQEALENVKRDYGITNDQEVLQSATRAAGNIGLDSLEIDESGNLVRVDFQSGKRTKAGKVTSRLGDFTENRQKLEKDLSSTYSSLEETYNSLKSVLESIGVDPQDYASLSKEDLKNSEYENAGQVAKILKDYNTTAGKLIELAKNEKSEAVRSKYSKSGLEETFSDLKPSSFSKLVKSPAFKVGLNTVPFDDFPALLHKGEMVLTAHNADMLRSLTSGSSIGTFLSSLLEGSQKTTATAATSESTSDAVTSAIVTAIGDQTAVLSGSLNSILSLLNQIVQTPNRDSAGVVSPAVLSFEGA